MGRAAVLGVFMVSLAAMLAPPGMANVPALAQQSSTFRMLNNPTGGDAFMFRGAIQQNAQGLSNRLFGALAAMLGGEAPQLNFVPSGSPLTEGDLSANVRDSPGAPQGSINLDPLAVEGLTNFKSPYHDSSVNAMPHEMAHLRQTPQTLADLISREGGAQAFADLVAPDAAKQARIPYAPGSFDGNYAPYVQQVQQRGRDWILKSQFGR